MSCFGFGGWWGLAAVASQARSRQDQIHPDPDPEYPTEGNFFFLLLCHSVRASTMLLYCDPLVCFVAIDMNMDVDSCQ